MRYFGPFVENLRPRQWTKNLLLFAGIIFARQLGHSGCLIRSILGVGVFCLSSGVVYIFNDIADRDLDKHHPDKRSRPVASGRLPVAIAVRGGLVLALFCLGAAWALGTEFLAGVVFFFLWNVLYTKWLKRVPVLDVVGIGMSFVVRAVSGVLVILPVAPSVSISHWLLLCTFFLSLFLGFCKRRDEYLKVQQVAAKTRPALHGYTEPLLNAMIGVSFALTGMAYALYTIWPRTIEEFGTRNLVYTLPLVLTGMGRFLYLVFLEDLGGRPHEILLMDKWLQLVVVTWTVTVVLVIGI